MAKPASDRGAALPALCVGSMLVFALVLLALGAARLPFWYDESLTVRLSRLGSIARAVEGRDRRVRVHAAAHLRRDESHASPARSRDAHREDSRACRVRAPQRFPVHLPRATPGRMVRVGRGGAASAGRLHRPYAIEARAYMLLLGVSAIALVCWQSTVDRRSRLAPLGLACSVATALLLHVWAILLPLALTAGEAVEFLRTRRLRWRVIWPLIAAAPALGVYPILLRASKTVIFGGPAYAPTPDKLYAAFRSDVPRPRVVVAVVAGDARRRMVGAQGRA